MNIEISVVICCYNSAERIPKVLETIMQQQFSDFVGGELILVDNNSSDNTIEVVEKIWQNFSSPFQLRIIKESRQGHGYAWRTGLSAAQYEYIVNIDDDNYLFPNYLQKVIDTFLSDAKIAICGGQSFLPIEYKELPYWWNQLKKAYAVGSQAKKAGKVKHLYTAGMGIKKSVYEQLVASNHQFRLSGRQGETVLGAGEEYEICYATQLLGYKVYYNPELKFYHAISPHRINKNYLLRLYQGNGEIISYLSAYKFVLKWGKHNWLLELIFDYLTISYFSLYLLIQYLRRNKAGILKGKMEMIITLTRLRHLFSIAPADYNAFCNSIKQLKS